MTKIMFLPRDHITLDMQQEGGLSDLSENVLISHDINELSEAIKNSEDDSHIVVTDLGWDRGYELLIQDFAKSADERKDFTAKHPVILFSNTYYVPEGLGVVGTLKTAETFGDVSKGNSLRQSPSILSLILREAIKDTAQNFTSEKFKSLKNSISNVKPREQKLVR